MSDERKKDIESTVAILKQLDERSLLIIESSAKVLAARMAMEQAEQSEKQTA